MDAETYDQWYETSRGRWIGRTEADLCRAALEPRPRESLLDVGCGTGYFTRALAGSIDGRVMGVDLDEESVAGGSAVFRGGERKRTSMRCWKSWIEKVAGAGFEPATSGL